MRNRRPVDKWLDALVEQRRGDPATALQPAQIAVAEDPSTFRVVYGGRRAGKTFLIATELLRHTWPGEISPYVAPTIGKGRDILWPALRRIAQRYGIDLHFDLAKHRVTLPNGGHIQLFSLDNISEAELLRGDRHPFAVLDEAGTRKTDLLRYAVLECLQPATAEFRGRGGRGLLLGGSPSQHGPVGYWYELCQARGHKITIFDNTSEFPEPHKTLAEIREENGWTEATPEYRREWLGEFTISGELLPYASVWNGQVLPDAIAPAEGLTCLALDIGYHHPNGWVVVRVTGRYMHVLHAETAAQLTAHQIAAKTRELAARYKVGYMIGDSSGNRLAIETLRRDHGLPIVPAEKPGQKVDRIEATRGMLQSETLFIHHGGAALGDEFRRVAWNEDHTDHHEAHRDELCDAIGYLVVAGVVRQHLAKAETPTGPSASEVRKQAALARARRSGAPY